METSPGVFELLGEAAMSIVDPDELSIAERHALDFLLRCLAQQNKALLDRARSDEDGA